MSEAQSSSRSLPQKPSAEYLRKQAKRIARAEAIQLATVQRRLAHEYGYRNWAELITEVERRASAGSDDGGSVPAPPPSAPPTGESDRDIFPFLPLRGLVAFPHVSYPIFVGRRLSINAVLYAKEHNVPILLAAQKDAHASEVSSSDMYDVGIMAGIIEVQRLPDGTLKMIIEGRKRVRITRFIFSEDFSRVHAEEIEEPGTSNPRLESLITAVVSAFVRERLSTIAEALNKPEALSVLTTTTDGASVLADRISSEMQMELRWKQALLELPDPADRLERLLTYLSASK